MIPLRLGLVVALAFLASAGPTAGQPLDPTSQDALKALRPETLASG